MVSSVFTIPLVEHHTKGGSATETRFRPAGPLRELIAGPENAMLWTAADAVRSCSPRYNPLVLTGPGGVGKTHMLHALACCYRAGNPTGRMIQLKASDYLRLLARAGELNSLPDLRAKHRRAHLFLFDDLHDLASRAAAQQELLNTIEALLSRSRVVVVACRPALSDLHGMLPGLTSRLSAGLSIPIALPEPATKRAILRRLAELHGLKLSEDAIDSLLASPPHSPSALHSVSQMRDAILQLRALDDRQIDVHAVRQFLQQQSARPPLSARSITRRVARHFRFSVSDLTGPSRRQAIVAARGVAIYLARKLTGISFDQLGHHFGGRDHTTVLHAYRRIESRLDRDPALRSTVAELWDQLNAVTSLT